MTEPEPNSVMIVTLSEISNLFSNLFANRRSDGRLCIGALPNKSELAEAEEFHAKGHPVPRRLKPWWQFYSPGQSGGMVKFLSSIGQTRGLHMRQSRFHKEATRGLRENVVEATHVWVDIDVKNYIDLYQRKFPGKFADLPALVDHVIDQLGQWRFRPTAVVSSGGGVHAYWALKESALDQEGFATIERVNKSLARVWGGDEAAVSVNDPLRLPGTWNFNYSPPRRCTLVWSEGLYYDLRGMLDALVQMRAVFGPAEFDDGTLSAIERMAAGLGTNTGTGKRKSEAEWAQVIKDLSNAGKRHGAALSLCGKLSHMGLDKTQIMDVLRQNGCTLTEYEMDQIAGYAVARRAEGRAA